MVEYKFIAEVARHGARAPSVLFDLTAPGQDNFPEPMRLTQLGAEQHYGVGQYVREKFFQGRDLSSMKSAGVYAMSTDKTRTKESATSQLQGLFGAELSFPELQPGQYPLVFGVDEDRLILTDGKNCHRFDEVEEGISASDEWNFLFNKYMPEEYLNDNLYDWIREETGLYDYDLLQMSDVATYMNIAHYHGMELQFPVSEEHNKWAKVSSDQFTYEWLAASEEIWQLAMQKMLRLLHESVDIVFNKGDPLKTEVVRQNLYAENSEYFSGEFPYFWLMLGHQETLFPLTNALGEDRAAKLPFSGAYFFEFFTYGEDDFVSTRLRDDKGKVHEIDIDCDERRTIMGQGIACSADSFQRFIEQRLFLADSVACYIDYDPVGVTYADPKEYAERLLSEIGIEDDYDFTVLYAAGAAVGALVGSVAAYAACKAGAK